MLTKWLVDTLIDSEESFWSGRECRVVLWRSEALDCRVPFPPETWNGFTHDPPSGIRNPDLLRLRADPWPLDYRDHWMASLISCHHICIFIVALAV